MMVNEIYPIIAQQGWQCPLCKRVYSPFTPCCYYCGAEGRATTSTDWVKHESTTETGRLNIGGITIAHPLGG